MASGHVGREELMKKLQELEIETTTVEHPEVFTVEAMLEHVGHLPGITAKNLFMRDKKKTKLWLLSARHDRPISLNDLAKQLGAKGGLRLADESVLQENLGVTQGCVTPFALLNDHSKKVTFVIDEDLLTGDHEYLYFHPMTNAATTGIKQEDLKKFVKAVDHEIETMKF